MLETFRHSNEVVLDTSNFLTVCTTLPALQEGHVIGNLEFLDYITVIHFSMIFPSFAGYSKMLPSEHCLDKFMELWLLKVTYDVPCFLFVFIPHHASF
jgi:hypothetical protein